MAIVITYKGEIEPATGLEFDRPGVELLRSSFPTAEAWNSADEPAVIETSSNTEVENFIAKYANGSTFFCVGGEQVNGITNHFINTLGIVDPTPSPGDDTGYIKSIQYKGKNFFFFTGGATPTAKLDSRQGTVSAIYYLTKNDINVGVGENFSVKTPATDIGLYAIDLTQGDVIQAINDCNEGFIKFALKNILEESGVTPDSFEIVDCFVENNKLYAIIVDKGSIPFVIWGVIAIASIAISYFGFGAWETAEREGTKQAHEEAIKAQNQAISDVCNAKPAECGQNIKTLTDANIAQAKLDAEKAKWDAEKAGKESTLGQFSDLLKTALIVGIVGIGVTFLFKSGLFEAGVTSTRQKLERKKLVQPKKKK